MGALPTDWRSPEQRRREADLAQAAKKGDRRAWTELYSLLAPELYRRVLMPRLGNPSAAEDALSETFRIAIERIESFEDQGHGVYPWLCRIAHNRAMDLHRAHATTGRKLRDLTSLLEATSAPIAGADELYEARVEERQLGGRLQVALRALNPRYKQAISLRFLEGRSREDCATALELRLGTFDVLILRALRALRARFPGDGSLNPPPAQEHDSDE